MRDTANLIRDLTKVADVLAKADEHFAAEGAMNAALHMSATVRPAPLASAVAGARADLARVIFDLEASESVNETVWEPGHVDVMSVGHDRMSDFGG